MKVILKGGGKSGKIEDFFMSNILPILNSGIAIEPSDRVITVYEKKDGKTIEYVDPTAEVMVSLTIETIGLAKNKDVSEEILREKSGNFFDEALAIRKIEELKPAFSIGYHPYLCTAAN